MSCFNQISINSLIFPPTIEWVGSTVFYQSFISNFFFPSSLKSFHKDALNDIRSLDNLIVEDLEALISRNGVVMDEKQTTIFFISESIKSFEVSPVIKYIEASQFRSHHIIDITVLPGNNNFSSYNGILYNKKGTVLIAFPGGKVSATLADSCERIDDLGFWGYKVVSVKLNKKLKTIGKQAFYSCSYLKSINIPSSLETVKSYALRGTTNLSIKIAFGSKIKNLEWNIFMDSAIKSVDFSSCSLLEIIPISMFESSKIESVKLPPNLKTISSRAFASSSIKSIKLPKSTKELLENCFYDCPNLKSLDISNTAISSIEDSCFEKSGIVSISLPASIESISALAFASCKDLKSVEFAPQTKLNTIAPYIIDSCTSLKTFKITSQVKVINDGAFANSHGLQDFEIEENEAFSVDNGILYSKDRKTLVAFPGGRESAIIDKGVSHIQVLAFAGCINLKSVSFEIGSTLESLGENTFLGCAALEDVRFPESLKSFASTAFSGCVGLRKVSFDGDSALVEVPDAAFKGCSRLEYFEFHPGIETVGASAFEGCALHNFTLYNSSRIGNRAFFGCKLLSSVRVFGSLETLGASAFGSCGSLKAFSYCGETVCSEDVFAGSGLDIVLVSSKYKGEKFSNVNILRILDKDCAIPTFAFTENIGFCVCGALCLQSATASE